MPWVLMALLGLTTARSALVVAARGRAAAPGWAGPLREALSSVLVACALVLLLVRPFALQAFYVPSGSMHPTLVEDDRILVDKLSYAVSPPRRHDVVVFRAPQAATLGEEVDDQEEDFVKRVVGVPGDRVAVRAGALYLNGARQAEAYTAGPSDYEYGPVTVPAGRLFVMGDNRNHSNDSRRWGTLQSDRVIGRAIAIFWPPGRARIIR